jgi:hypothetical protein
MAQASKNAEGRRRRTRHAIRPTLLLGTIILSALAAGCITPSDPRDSGSTEMRQTEARAGVTL